MFDVGHVDADGAASGEWFVLPATTALRASRRRRQKLSGQSRLDRQDRRLRLGEGRVHARVLQSECADEQTIFIFFLTFHLIIHRLAVLDFFPSAGWRQKPSSTVASRMPATCGASE